ncbi:MAG: vitamin K epoxide reductase family protein [Bacteroides sp.]|nr:vitamin K epoxide reductase family protein [Bacteroides sp.]MCM1380252.1 vitamin K epoxide reductase family protein [Bacteroides sp.]MCM1446546.1 vitamin K epoxide reductase family protein [Prevotella sp.]
MAIPTILTRYLAALEVPHTEEYSDLRFHSMPFKSFYGLQHLLAEYNIPSEGLRISDKSELTKLTPPFLAETQNGPIVLVERVTPAEITFDTHGNVKSCLLQEFEAFWSGAVFIAHPHSTSREPEYASHHLTEIIQRMAKYALAAAALVVFAYFFITRGVYEHVSTVLLIMFNCVGLYLSYMLLQKTLHIHTRANDRVCGVLEHGGCDEIMQLKVSKLFGVFSWSEVGFGYFGISLLTLLMFPHLWPALALCNVCCLPYTVWSIWYQKFRAKHWCTLCVGVQSTLWVLFICYLGGGWLSRSFPLHPDIVVLLAAYVFAVLFLNMIIRTLKNLPRDENDPRT